MEIELNCNIMETKKGEAIVVIVIGDKYKKIYNTNFRKSHERFAKKIGRPLIIFNNYIDKNQKARERSPAWQALCIFEAKETENYDRLCFIDADIYITTKARNPFEETEIGTFGIVDNNPYNLPDQSASNNILYQFCPLENRPEKMMNGGVFVAERNIHAKTLSYIYNHYEEQLCYYNGPISYHVQTEHKITLLSPHFNTVIPNIIKKYGVLWLLKIPFSGFIHFCGEIHMDMFFIVKKIDEHPLKGILDAILNKIKNRFSSK